MANLQRGRKRGRWLAVTVLAAVVITVALAILSADIPPLRVRRSGDTFIVDVQTLGEYPTTVQRVRLSRGGDLVWEVRAPAPPQQLHTFALRLGTNPAVLRECGGSGPITDCEPSWPREQWAVLTPARGDSFRLERGVEYELEVWGSDSSWSRAAARLTP